MRTVRGGKVKKGNKTRRTSVLSMGPGKARKFFLMGESYCRFLLPEYLEFDGILRDVDGYLTNHQLHSVSGKAHEHSGVNHTILDNKDGRYAWRPMELIHPAAYVDLVHLITEPTNWRQLQGRFRSLRSEKRIACMSIPVQGGKRDGKRPRRDRAAKIRRWWEEIEQRSIRLALKYQHVCHTDITDCYGALYTHSVAWAMHGKRKAKRCRNDKNLLGNGVDRRLRAMREGQTNGVPQGSVLIDLVVELVLCYADRKIGQGAKEAGICDYKILRYRDDYRIFVNDAREGELLLKIVSEVVRSLGLKLNAGKTVSSDDVLTSAVKEDKVGWNGSVQRRHVLQKHLLLIRELSKSYPHSGSLDEALASFDRRLAGRKRVGHARELISLVVDIAVRNPRAYAVCASILSKLLMRLTPKRRRRVLDALRQRFAKIPHTGHLQIWLQRFTYPVDPEEQYEEPICELVAGKPVAIWNSDWINSEGLSRLLDPMKIVNAKRLKKLRPTISPAEVNVFVPRS